jgi:hypothetical protein
MRIPTPQGLQFGGVSFVGIEDAPAAPIFDATSSHVSGASADRIETIRIKPAHPSQGPFVTINATDFDEAAHEVYDGDEAVETPAGRWLHR